MTGAGTDPLTGIRKEGVRGVVVGVGMVPLNWPGGGVFMATERVVDAPGARVETGGVPMRPNPVGKVMVSRLRVEEPSLKMVKSLCVSVVVILTLPKSMDEVWPLMMVVKPWSTPITGAWGGT